MRVLVTGGAGFIGSHLSERLLQCQHEVSIIDDLNDYYPPHLKHGNLRIIKQSGPFKFYEVDICDEKRVSQIVRGVRPEVIVHLAARAGVLPSLEQPCLYERVNVGGTVVMLEAARQNGVEKFVFASSSSIYGVANRVPFSEEDTLNLPISPYAATKIAGEKMAYTWSRLYKLSVVCLRFFTVFGPRQRPDLAICKFADLISKGRPVTVYGDGASGRDYTYVADIVDGILSAIDHDCRFDVFNIGGSHPIDLNTMIATVEKAIGREARRKHLPQQPGDVPITFADISKARRVLGYCPKVSFADGIARFVEWYRMQEPAAKTAAAGASVTST